MYADDMGRQVEATHFCLHLAPDFHQCVIFDSNTAKARLVGIEYIISEERFKQLPEEEKRRWHSHHYEIKSGQLMAPGVPEMAEYVRSAAANNVDLAMGGSVKLFPQIINEMNGYEREYAG